MSDGDPETWRDSLPEGFAEAPFIKAADSPEAALQELTNAADYMGNSMRIPGADASEDDRNEFTGKVLEKMPNLVMRPTAENMEEYYNSMGRPAKSEEYNYEPPEDREIPADFEEFSKIAHKHGLNQDQFRGLLGDVLEGQWLINDQISSEQKEALEGLSNDWGAAFDQNLSQVKNFLRLTDAPEGLVNLISEDAMSPTEIQWLHSLAGLMKSNIELSDTPTTAPEVMGPAEAQNKIQEIMNNQEHAYWNQGDPRHSDAMKRMRQLQEFANPG